MDLKQNLSNSRFFADTFEPFDTSISSYDSKVSDVESTSTTSAGSLVTPRDFTQFDACFSDFPTANLPVNSSSNLSSNFPVRNIWNVNYKNNNPLTDLPEFISNESNQEPLVAGVSGVSFGGHRSSYSGPSRRLSYPETSPPNNWNTATQMELEEIYHGYSNIHSPQPVHHQSVHLLQQPVHQTPLQQPVYQTQFQPVHQQLPPAHQQLPPAHHQLPPAHQQLPPRTRTQKQHDNIFKNFTGAQFVVKPNSVYFVIKSFSLVDVNASFINSIWASTESGNRRLSAAYKRAKANNADVFLFFSVNGSGKFCGVAKMTSDIDFDKVSHIWSEISRWKGIFNVEWIFMKDIPNRYFQHLKVPSNDDKSVTNSRDTQEIPYDVAVSMLRIYSTFKSSSTFLM